jgi:nucleotide-binding universal stress UspA family protein
MTTLPFRSILCPVDFSQHAAEALRHAATIAERAGARLTVAWIADPLLAQAAAVHVLEPRGVQARTDLREFVAESLSAGAPARPEAELELRVGTPDQ